MWQKKKLLIMIGLFINIAVYTSGCGQFLNAAVGAEKSGDEKQGVSQENILYEITRLDRVTGTENAEIIDISSLNQEMDESRGYSYKEACLTIWEPGCYVLSGEAENLKLVVNVYEDEVVHLILEQVELCSQDGPAIYVEQAGKVVITVKEGTQNTISDGVEYASAMEACIFSNSDLTINGGGQLNVYGYYHDAVRSKDQVKVLDSQIYILSQNDGIRGNDGIICENSEVEIESKGTGMITNSQEGFVAVSGGVLKITAGENAVYADSLVSIRNCNEDLYSVYEPVHCNGIKQIEEESKK